MEEEGGEGGSQTKEQEDRDSHTKELEDKEDRSSHAKEVEDKVVRSSYTKDLEDKEDKGEDREKPAVPARPQLDHQVGGHSVQWCIASIDCQGEYWLFQGLCDISSGIYELKGPRPGRHGRLHSHFLQGTSLKDSWQLCENWTGEHNYAIRTHIVPI